MSITPTHLTLDCTTGETATVPFTADEITAASAAAAQASAAQQAQAQLAANASTIQANIHTHLAQIETWLAANPNGAVLTAAQTAALARMLVGVGRILLQLVDTVGQS